MTNDEIEEIEDVIEDTEEILEDTKSIDKKLWILIGLWILDKVIILGMFWFMR